MIRITKQTDYGIVLLTHMAATPERRANAPELATETRLPLPMVSKILKLLVREGVLLSHRGVKGGYGLGRSPEEISMAEVISALEGPIAITECIDDHSGCSHEAFCGVRGRWQRINTALRETLEGITLAEMAEQARPQQKLVTLGAGRSAFAGA
jgi:FeS assembly SUF system regulator